MKLHLTLLATAALAAAALPATAGDRNPFGNNELPEILKPFDVNENGRLDESERQAYLDAVRDAHAGRPDRPDRPGRPDRPHGNPWDTDGNGVLSDEEKAAAQEAIRLRILQHRTKRFEEMDKDENGSLSLEEIAAIPGIRPGNAARILAHLDGDDEDNEVSLEEFLAALQPPHRGRPGGDGNPPPPRPPDGGGARR